MIQILTGLLLILAGSLNVYCGAVSLKNKAREPLARGGDGGSAFISGSGFVPGGKGGAGGAGARISTDENGRRVVEEFYPALKPPRGSNNIKFEAPKK